MADLYRVLGVARGASQEEIRKAYRKLAARLHPDKNPGDQRAEERFKEVNRAHQVLSDARRRALYDEFGEDGLREGFNPQAARAYRRATSGGRAHFGGGPGISGSQFVSEGLGGFGDLFGELFRTRERGNPRGSGRGADVQSEVTVDFASAIRGAELKLQARDGSTPITVRVPPGAADGDKVRVAGQGAPSRFGGPKGDLVLSIRVLPHPHFKREGLDLTLDLPITVGEAFRGARVPIPIPSGDVTLTVPAGAQSGQVVRLKGKGVARKGQVGDLYVRFLVKLPTCDRPEVAEAVDVLERAMRGDIRGTVRF